ncbi:MAG: hypothetical protein V1775_08935 [Bacteroidota bacterium]
MTGLNEDSLRKAIHNLPKHKAGDYVWEEIRWHLEKPLVAELPLHTAPVSVWNGILAASVVTNPVNIFRRAVPVAMIIILITSVLYPLFLNETDIDKSLTTQTDGFTAPSPSRANPAPQEIHAILMTSPDKSGIKSESAFFSPEENVSATEPTATEPSILTKAVDPAIPLTPLDLISHGYIGITGPSVQETMRQRNDKRNDGCSSFHEVNSSVFLQADYNPEFFNTSVINSPGNNFSISPGYQHNRFRITLGAGYTRLNSHTRLSYEYRTNELIYSYDYVDSVYFDPITHETSYFTVKVDVYDSIDHAKSEKVNDRYSYLQFPLTLSYELASFRRLSVLLHLTGTYHLLQDNYRNYKPFYEASSRLVSLKMEEKNLSSDFWSAGGGVLLEYRAGSRLGFNLTPVIRYSNLSVSGVSEKGLTSYGINFGLNYKIIADR